MPCHVIIHPDFAIPEGDLHLDVGKQIKFLGTRFLNSSNMMFVFRIEAVNKCDTGDKSDVKKDSVEVDNVEKEEVDGTDEQLLKTEIY